MLAVNTFKYCLVRRVAKRFGMKETGEDEDWSLFWTDYSVALERCMDMKRYQVGLTRRSTIKLLCGAITFNGYLISYT